MQPRLTTVLLGLFALAGCGGRDSADPHVEVIGAIVTLPAASGRPGAAYVRLEANRAVGLTSIASPRIGRIELHEPGMRRTDAMMLAPGEPLVFEPGGRHAMLFGLHASLRPGGRVSLIFHFEGAPAVTAEAEVRRAGDVHGAH